MRSKLKITPATVLAALALFVALGGTSYAISSINGSLLKNRSVAGVKLKKHTVTGSEVNVSSFPKVPSSHLADTLTTLPSGKSESGAFSGAGGTSTGGWYGFAITYARPLATEIANNHIIDTFTNPSPTVCPGVGKAAHGYLCLYFQYHFLTGTIYGYSTNPPYNGVSPSVGVGLYAPITGSPSYANGVWTVTAP